MARLIDADEALLRNDKMKNRSDVFRSYAKVVIDGTPTIDALPVVHGRWETEMDDMGWNKHTCPICGYVKRTDIHVRLGWNYCPNCGADMRERSESK